MDNIKDVTLVDLEKTKYIKPRTIHYTQNGRKKTWDILEVHDSVVILIFNVTRKKLIFVKQFRPAIYVCRAEVESGANGEVKVDTEKYPGTRGVTYELCAGLVDKEKPVEVIAQEEIIEECGYKVPLDKITKVCSYRSNVGTSGPLQTLFYAEVTDDMKVGEGGGVHEEGEMIDVIEVSLDDGKPLIMDESVVKPVAMMFAMTWFYENKAPAFMK